MKLRRRIHKTTNQASIQALVNKQWMALRPLKELEKIAEKHQVQGDLASDMLAVLALGDAGWQELTAALEGGQPVNEQEYDKTLPFQPSSFREFTLYEEHFSNVLRLFVERYMPTAHKIATVYERLTGKTFPKFKPNDLWYKQPVYYYGSHLNFYGDGDEAVWPDYVDVLDFELEFGAIISKPITNATKQEARDAIGGFVLVNDWSSRGAAQKAEMESGNGPQKSKHFANSLGDVVVTADELRDRVQSLSGTIKINGELISTCSSANMAFSFEEIIEFLSNGQTMYPGELLASGCLPKGCGFETNRFISKDEELVFEMDELGELTNRVVSQ